MRYKSFRIQNFKGIQDTTVQLDGIGGPAVFAFVGLNESGKTTVLEAIHSFCPDAATSELLGGEEGLGVSVSKRVPRHKLSNFTGNVSVAATLAVNEQDKQRVAQAFKSELNLDLSTADFPTELIMERQQQFKNGDYVDTFFTIRSAIKVKTSKQRSWRALQSGEEHVNARNIIYRYAPLVAYFPTFVFDFPEIVFLTDRGNDVDRFYRRVFQDILDFDGQGNTIDKDIVGRIRAKDMVLPWISFFTAWQQHGDREKIQHVMDRAGAAVTRLVFGRWNEIFREEAKGKQVEIEFQTTQGEKEDTAGTKITTNEHDVYIKFQIRDGTRRFNVNDRSLGFRWFFAFMLFTQFRVARASSRPLLFLFDEPASNLHAAAQQKLIESFPEIAQKEHMLAYSTHSHYMVEPKWLEQTFIVTNRADTPVASILDNVSLDDESLDIKVTRYRSFVNEYPTQTSYFQPILDRLEVVPSRLMHKNHLSFLRANQIITY